MRKSHVPSFAFEMRACGWDPGSSHHCNISCCQKKLNLLEKELASISQEAVQKYIFLLASPPMWKLHGYKSVSNNHVCYPAINPQSLDSYVPFSQDLAVVLESRWAPRRLPWLFKYPKPTCYYPDTVISLCAFSSLKCQKQCCALPH